MPHAKNFVMLTGLILVGFALVPFIRGFASNKGLVH